MSWSMKILINLHQKHFFWITHLKKKRNVVKFFCCKKIHFTALRCHSFKWNKIKSHKNAFLVVFASKKKIGRWCPIHWNILKVMIIISGRWKKQAIQRFDNDEKCPETKNHELTFFLSHATMIRCTDLGIYENWSRWFFFLHEYE